MTFVQVLPNFIFAGLLSLGLSLPATAQVVTPTTLPGTVTTVFQNISVTGASNYDNTTTPAQPVIFGGYTGPYGDCATATTGTCNACTALTTVCDTSGNAIAHCAERSITQSTILTITFTAPSTAQINGTVVVRTASMLSGSLTLANTPVVQPNSPVTVQLQWGTICAAESNAFNGDCTGLNGSLSAGISDTLTVSVADISGNVTSGGSQQFTLRLTYIDGKYSGGATSSASSAFAGAATPFLTGCTSGSPFCDFALGDGDGKVYVNNLASDSTLADSSAGVKWNSARLYFAPYGTCTDAQCAVPSASGTANGLCSINLATASSADLYVVNKNVSDPADGGYSVASSTIKGLTNDQSYIFLLASQDEASIVSGFMDSGVFNDVANCSAGGTNVGLDGSCPYLGFPGQVVGLLSDQKCFIATAAYGSPLEAHVMALRHFRDRFLMTNRLGTWFVHTYYRLSPPLANWIFRHPTARAVVRGALWPLVWFADWMTGESLPQNKKAAPGAKK
jgi:hypothetical protein